MDDHDLVKWRRQRIGKDKKDEEEKRTKMVTSGAVVSITWSPLLCRKIQCVYLCVFANDAINQECSSVAGNSISRDRLSQ